MPVRISVSSVKMEHFNVGNNGEYAIGIYRARFSLAADIIALCMAFNQTSHTENLHCKTLLFS